MNDRAIRGTFHLGGDADWTMETDPNLVDVFLDEEEVTVLPTADYIRLNAMLAAACEALEAMDSAGRALIQFAGKKPPPPVAADEWMARLEAETEAKALAYLGDRQDGEEL
jgi:hypothetical protein